MTLISHQREGSTTSTATITQELIQNRVRLIVTPLELSKKSPSRFRIRMESYEASELLDMDLAETSLIEFMENQDPLLPLQWKISENSEFILEGILSFPHFSKQTRTFTLVIFSLSEYRLTWDAF